MTSFLVAVLVVFVVTSGGRDQQLIANLVNGLASGPRRPKPLLVIGALCACASAATMAYAGLAAAARLPAEAVQAMVIVALAAAALNLAWPIRRGPPREPTRSFGAIAIVLLALQLSDAARLMIFALAAIAMDPAAIGFGGAIAGMMAILIGWLAGASQLSRVPLDYLRRGLAAGLFVAAMLVAATGHHPAVC